MTRPRVCVAAVVAAAVAAALSYGAPPAHGAPYVVVGCADVSYVLSGYHAVRGTDGWVADGPAANTCHEGVAGRGLAAASSGPFVGFRFDAPSGTAITDLWSYYRARIPVGAAVIAEALRDGRWTSVSPGRAAGVTPLDFAAWSQASFGRASALRLGASCPAWCASPASLEVRTVAVGLDDPDAPLLDPLPVALDGDELSFTLGATDHGSGVASMTAAFAGREVAHWRGGGTCAELVRQLADIPHYEAPTPCPEHTEKAFTADTAELPDGDHELTFRAEDGAGNASTSTARVVLDNQPPADGTVRLTGHATVGERLAAELSGFAGQDPTVTVAWERCAEPGEPCTPIAANQHDYTLGAADAGGRIRAHVTAVDEGGATTATSALSEIVTSPPTPATPPPTVAPAAPPTSTTIVVPAPATTCPAPTGTTARAASLGKPRARAAACTVVAAGRPRLTAWFDGPYGQRLTAKRVRRGARVRIRGRLTDARGRAIAGAAVALVEYVGGRSKRASGATTRADGRFTAFTRLGPPRRLRFTYRGVNGPLLRLTLRR